MLPYAWRCLNTRATLGGAALALALLAAVPGALAGTVLAPAVVAFVVTGDAVLAATLLPGPLAMPDASPAAWAAVAAAVGIALLVWARVYAVVVWTSDDARAGGVRRAWAGTRRSWRTVAALHAQAYAALAAVVLAGLATSGTLAPAGGAAARALTVVGVVLAARAAARVVLTLAARAAVFDGERGVRAWRRAAALVSVRRRDVVAAWIVLASVGAVVWIGGRLVSPVLQDTALTYPHDSAYAAARELGHALLAVPLEAFLVALAAGVWTALYREVPEDDRERTRPAGRRGDPWVVRALAALAVLTVVGNAVPTGIDAAWDRDVEASLDAIDATTIEPLAALRDAPARPPGGPRTSYDVDAELDDGVLTWTTHVELVNDTGARLTDVGVNVYPAAFDGRVEDLPMADELLATDLAGTLRRDAEPGELTLEDVRVDGEPARHSFGGTALVVELERPLHRGARASIEIDLRCRLPVWPDRFGVWDDTAVLGNWIPLVAVREAGGWRMDAYGDVGDPFFSEIADVRVRIVTDARDGVVGTGVLTGSEALPGGRRSWTFDAPAVRDAAYVVAPDLRGLERRAGGVTVRSWYPADEAPAGAANARAATSAVGHYTRAFGALPYDEVEIVEGGGFLGGMEYPGVVMTSAAQQLEGVPLLPQLLAHAGFDDARGRYVAGHEIAHQWWYAAVGNDQLREPWLDEALAEVSTRLWLRAEDGDDRTWRMTVMRAGARPRAGVVGAGTGDFTSNPAYGEAVYLAGSEVLMELRERVGADAFAGVLRAWYRRSYLGIGTVDGFVETVRDVAGADAAAWLERYR